MFSFVSCLSRKKPWNKHGINTKFPQHMNSIKIIWPLTFEFDLFCVVGVTCSAIQKILLLGSILRTELGLVTGKANTLTLKISLQPCIVLKTFLRFHTEWQKSKLHGFEINWKSAETNEMETNYCLITEPQTNCSGECNSWLQFSLKSLSTHCSSECKWAGWAVGFPRYTLMR